MGPAAVEHLADEVAEHRLGHREVGDHPVAQRSRRRDRRRRAPDHPLGVGADRVHLAGRRVRRHHRGLRDDDPPTVRRTRACSPCRGRSPCRGCRRTGLSDVERRRGRFDAGASQQTGTPRREVRGGWRVPASQAADRGDPGRVPALRSLCCSAPRHAGGLRRLGLRSRSRPGAPALDPDGERAEPDQGEGEERRDRQAGDRHEHDSAEQAGAEVYSKQVTTPPVRVLAATLTPRGSEVPRRRPLDGAGTAGRSTGRFRSDPLRVGRHRPP